jgi:hypothetical protein
MKKEVDMSAATQNVSVRLPKSIYDDVTQLAQSQKCTVSEILRDKIMNATLASAARNSDQELLQAINDVSSRVDALREEVRQLKENHAEATAALLVDAGKAEVDEAEDWVRANLIANARE